MMWRKFSPEGAPFVTYWVCRFAMAHLIHYTPEAVSELVCMNLIVLTDKQNRLPSLPKSSHSVWPFDTFEIQFWWNACVSSFWLEGDKFWHVHCSKLDVSSFILLSVRILLLNNKKRKMDWKQRILNSYQSTKLYCLSWVGTCNKLSPHFIWSSSYPSETRNP